MGSLFCRCGPAVGRRAVQEKLPVDGQTLRKNTESRLHRFKIAESYNRLSRMTPEHFDLMKELADLSDRGRQDCTCDERTPESGRGGLRGQKKIRKLRAVIQTNPFQFCSPAERQAAWKAARQSYLDEEGSCCCKKQKSRSKPVHLQQYVQIHLDGYPRLLDRYNHDSADDNEREYMGLMQEIAKLAGKDGSGNLDILTEQKNGEAIAANGATRKNLPLTRPRPNKKGYQHDKFFPSYTYRFVCWECSVHFKDENLLKLHKLQHAETSGEAAGSHDCPVCDRIFGKLQNLLMHVLDHSVKAAQITHFIPTADPSIMCFASKSAAPMDVLAQSHDGHELCFMYSCGLNNCGLRFCTEAMADLHQLSHNLPDDYQGDTVCAGCNYVAANAGDLLKHVGRHAAKANDRKLCRVCGDFVELMVEHVRSVHKEHYLQYEARLTLFCDQCEKRFRTPIHLATHKACAPEHRSLEVLGCLVCAQQFPSSLLLHAHIKKEHTTGLTCMICQKSYSKYLNLQQHSKTHKEVHVCNICGAVFRSKYYLVQHEPVHRSDYSFKCDLCDKTFKRSSNLWQHKMIVHTDKVRKQRKAKREEMRRKGVVSKYKCPRQRMRFEEFPYKCEECRLGWMLLGNLQQHQRKKHSQSVASEDTGTSQPVSSSSGNV
ncbi:zinc finger protein 287-like isoform X1 [Paramacrobiotus metropolitanus]|uniref:zinc finger protein 287-like isoform X1 n=1 Tax=Paramacrobiotus metropolitanus TaxID=2943436 RepID=UPI002445D8EE|nr:zinc finger protein 287-like isoform X1 [Paramacrobiotus metropolitanus]XP_055334130.1 zinc finger protein 287-like isoform X1 [Paramacrobiotus metropolitanus]